MDTWKGRSSFVTLLCTCWNKQRPLQKVSYTSTNVLWESKWAFVGVVFTDALIIVEVGDSQAAPKVRAHLFSWNHEIQHDVSVSLCPKHHGTLGLIPRRPCQHGVLITAQQLFLLQNWVTCGWRHIKATFWERDPHPNSYTVYDACTLEIFTHITVSLFQLAKIFAHGVPGVCWVRVSPSNMNVSFESKQKRTVWCLLHVQRAASPAKE